MWTTLQEGGGNTEPRGFSAMTVEVTSVIVNIKQLMRCVLSIFRCILLFKYDHDHFVYIFIRHCYKSLLPWRQEESGSKMAQNSK